MGKGKERKVEGEADKKTMRRVVEGERERERGKGKGRGGKEGKLDISP